MTPMYYLIENAGELSYENVFGQINTKQFFFEILVLLLGKKANGIMKNKDCKICEKVETKSKEKLLIKNIFVNLQKDLTETIVFAFL